MAKVQITLNYYGDAIYQRISGRMAKLRYISVAIINYNPKWYDYANELIVCVYFTNL